MASYDVTVTVTDPMLKTTWDEVVTVQLNKSSHARTAAIKVLRERFAWTGYTYKAKGVQTREDVPA